MKKLYLQYKFVIQIKYHKDYLKDSHLMSKVIRYLELEFDVQIKGLDENKKGIAMLIDEPFDQDKVADYIMCFTEPENVTIYNNE